MEVVSKKNNSQTSADYFRSILFATSYPGSIETLDNINSPSNMFSASCSIIKTFCDSYSNIFLGRNINNPETIENKIKFFCVLFFMRSNNNFINNSERKSCIFPEVIWPQI